MKKLTLLQPFLLFSMIIFLSACSEDSEVNPNPPVNQPGSGGNSPSDPNEWLLPINQVFDGGPGKDGIPSVDAPRFSAVRDVDYLDDDDLVLGIKVGSEVRAYPHPILDWHEIVNDHVNGLNVAITYCPLTGTGIGWDRSFNGQVTTFGVSGLLYNNNLIPYDRATDSNWSQMLLKSVNGIRIREEIETHQLVEMSWPTWKRLFPNSKVMNLQTGFDRRYSVYPYGDYKTNNNFLLFPLTNDDSRLERKERGLGVIVNDQAKFYRFEDFDDASVVLEQDNFNGKDLVVVGSKEQNFLIAYESRLQDGTLLQFAPVTEGDDPSVVMEDMEGNRWNIFGELISGPRQLGQLKPVDSYIGYWFAWGAFYPGLEIHNQ